MEGITIKGSYQDRLLDKKNTEIFNSGWKSNLIVLRCRILLAAFISNDTALGIRSLQVGRGDPSWDTTPPPVPDPKTIVQLVDSSPFTIPHTALTVNYLNADYEIVAEPTNHIQIVAKLEQNEPAPASEPPFPLREFGIFGELNGTPFMINCIRHSLIEKYGSTTLERTLRLIF